MIEPIKEFPWRHPVIFSPIRSKALLFYDEHLDDYFLYEIALHPTDIDDKTHSEVRQLIRELKRRAMEVVTAMIRYRKGATHGR